MIRNNFNKKKKKGSNGMEPKRNRLILNSSSNRKKYLNFLVRDINSYAGMAEWLSQLTDTQRPFGHAGSIPALGVTCLNLLNRKDEIII